MQHAVSRTDLTGLPRHWRLAMPLLLFVVTFVGLLLIGGGPVTNDELKYLTISTFTEAQPRLVNRYAHIYLQKFFVELAGDPIRGAQVYWAVLVSLTLAATFWISQTLAGWRGLWVGLAAVLLLLAQPLVFRYVGTTYADYTAMALITVGGALYLVALEARGVRRRWALVALGVLFLLALKSKETGIVTGIFVLGVVGDTLVREGRAGTGEALRQAGFWLAGVALAAMALMVADGVVLGDFWFSIRPSSFDALAAFNSGEVERTMSNWFSLILATDLGIPFVFLSLALAVSVSQKSLLAHRLLYFLPFLLIAFLLATMLGSRTRVIPRHLIPMVPVLCACAATYFDLSGITAMRNLLTRRVLIAGGAVVLALAVAGFLLRHTVQTTAFLGWTPHLFIVNIYYPAVLVALAAAFAFLPTEGLVRARAVLALFVAGLLPMLGALPNNLVFTSRVFENRIYPLAVFRTRMSLDSSSVIMMTFGAAITDNAAGRTALFPLYFGNLELNRNKRIQDNWPTGEKVDYVIAETADLKRWRREQVAIDGEIVTERSGRYVLICRTEPCRKQEAQ